MFNAAAPFHFTRYAKQSCLLSASWAKNTAFFFPSDPLPVSIFSMNALLTETLTAQTFSIILL